MMSADVVDCHGGTAGGSMGDDNPLAVFDAPNSFGGDSGGGGVMIASDGTADLLGTGSTADSNVRDESEDANLFDAVDGTLEEYDLSDDKREVSEDYGDGDEDDDENEEDDSVGSDLLDMEGWNLRRHRTEAEEEGGRCYVDDSAPDTAEDYGVDNNNTNAERGNSRRGLFGGWGSSRRGASQGVGNDLLSGDADSPSWSDANNSSNSGRGGGFFRRRGNTNAASNASLNSGITEETEMSYTKVAGDGIDEAGLAYGEGGITGDDDIVTETIDPELEEEQRMDNHLRPGDHIYIWQTYGINLRAYQRHAVVFSVTRRGDVDPLTVRVPDYQPTRDDDDELSFDMDTLYTDDEDDYEVTVVSFYHLNRYHQAHGAAQAAAASSNSRGKRSGCKREHLYDFISPDGITRKKPIHKVRYGRKVKKGLLSQKAVGTALKKDQVGLIMARVQYLLDNPDHLPPHNALSANGECASLWCVTGRWCTLQGASILAITCAGQAGGALLAGGILSNLTLLVPMPGIWGMAGWWWYVPATVAYPFLVPLLVTLGMASLVPLEILRRNRKKWRGITDGLNHEFWSGTSEAIKEEYFGVMATAEKEAEMRSFFGVREGETIADDARYMPVGGAPGGMNDSDDEDEALAMQQMEQSCQNMAADMNVDLSGRPPSETSPKGWGGFVGSFRGSKSPKSSMQNNDDELVETQRFYTSFEKS